ncbi:hypothetical protein MXB_2401 [Myxobolus squamalis]|nr:hypothetical protein MXB_2401 [Myxobolus squamalis]
MQSSQQPDYIIITQPDDYNIWSDLKLKKDIENGDISTKFDALQNLIFSIAHGQNITKDLLMFVIRFLLPVQDKQIKKLLLLFWELVPKYQSDGKLISEMILVCDAYRKVGCLMICSILMSTFGALSFVFSVNSRNHKFSSRSCLQFVHVWNTRVATYVIEKFLEIETDPSCQRNAYLTLIQIDQNRAINYLRNKATSVLSFGDVQQLAIIELVYSYCVDSYDKNSYLKYLYELLEASSPSVRFAAANTLLSLSDSSTALEYTSKCYTNLILKESDNNVKLVVLDRLSFIHSLKKNDWMLHDVALDLLSVLNVSASDSIVDLEVARRVLALVINLLTPERVETVVNFIRKEIHRVQKRFTTEFDSKKINSADKETVVYQQLLIKSIKDIFTRFQGTQKIVLPLLISNVASTHSSVASEILAIVRAIICAHPETKDCVFEQIFVVINSFTDPDSFRLCLWILASCATRVDQIEKIVSSINVLLVATPDCRLPIEKDIIKEKPKVQLTTVDGSYLTQPSLSAFSQPTSPNSLNMPLLNRFLSEGHTYICSSIATVLSKIVALHHKLAPINSNNKNYDDIDIQRTLSVINILVSGVNAETLDSFLVESDLCTRDYVNYSKKTETSQLKQIVAQDLKEEDVWGISFSSIINSNEVVKKENLYNQSLLAATGKIAEIIEDNIGNKVIPLTGLSDPIYAEAFIKISNFDVAFDVLVVNQTNDFVENVTLELRTQGEYKILSKSPPIVLSSLKFANIQACMRVTSSDCNVIFGTITYDTSGANRDSFSVILDEIRLDLTETSTNCYCSPDEFQNSWINFEWENKVTITTLLTDFPKLVDLVHTKTHMVQIVPNSELKDSCRYMVVNMYIKNRFGDEALANLSMEKQIESDKIIGQVRIRAKTQTMALKCFKKD